MFNFFYNKFKFTNIFTLFFVILIFIPKIDLIPIPGFWQGIRLDDVLIALIGLCIFINKKQIIFSFDKFYNGWLYFFIYLFFSNLIALLLDLEIKLIMILRVIEYGILMLFFYNIKIEKLLLKRLITNFLILNFIIVILQSFGFIGSISSLGYLPPDAQLNNRAYGILGGSWELAIVIPLSYFIILYLSKNNTEKIIYLILSLFILYQANSRMPIAAFLISISIFYIHKLYNLKFIILNLGLKEFYFYLLILILFIILCIVNFNYIFISSDYLSNFNLDINLVIRLIANLVLDNNVPLRSQFGQYDFSYWSLLYRLEHWSSIYEINLFTPLSFIFGSGLNILYTDSFFVRVALNFGFCGVILIFLIIQRVPIFILLFFFFTGLTLDLFISTKIFIFTLLLNKSYKNYATDN